MTGGKGKRTGRRIKRAGLHVALAAGAVAFAIPMIWLAVSSVKTDTQLATGHSLHELMIPSPVQLANYPAAWNFVPMFRYFINTSIVTALSIIGTVVSSSAVAFGFARLRWTGRDVVFLLLLSTMMLPPEATMIPVYLLFSKIGWVNTLRPLWVPSWFGTAFFIFLLRQFFLTIPRDLDDAAKIDGCGYFRLYTNIMLPLIKPSLIAVVIFQFVWSWNDFLGPLIYIYDQTMMTLTLGLQAFKSLYAAEIAMLLAATVMTTLPVILLFFFAQRYFIEGVSLTGLKE